VHPFAESLSPPLAEVGGKGLSLIRMTQAALAIPPGFVLPVSFFDPWTDALRAYPEWERFQQAGDAELRERCDALKARAAALRFSEPQRAAVSEALAPFPPGALFAVRSSSPEEDLEGASFAGGYETVLGVTAAGMEDAVRRAFASCLDVRVAVYKREQGFDVRSPRIAVVVQQQIASEVAGVGFSVDPITNDYDEASFSANWGLGETVVSGTASPDLYVVDKVRRCVASRRAGSKETSVWVDPAGGTRERADARHGELTLGDEQVLALTDAITKIEALYGKPMDIEWALAGGRLWLLQARPITTHLSLPDDLVTAPGAPRRLYWDVGISVQGILRPMSVMSTSVLRLLIAEASKLLLGKDVTARIETTVPFSVHGRLYLNLSNLLTLTRKASLVRVLGSVDPIAAESIEGAEEAAYRAPGAGLRRLRWRLLPRAPGKMLRILGAIRSPERARRAADRASSAFTASLHADAAAERPIHELARALFPRVIKLVLSELLPRFAASKVAMARIRRLFKDAPESQQRLVDRLDQSLPGNVTVEMGLELARMARALGCEVDPSELERSLSEGTAVPKVAKAWCDFLDRHGHRGPGELDVAVPRYRERPRLLMEQVAQLSRALEGSSGDDHERSRREREQATAELAAAASARGWLAGRRFRRWCRVIEALGGLRESPKFHIIQVVDAVRTRALAEGERLAAAGRLDRPEEIFDLWLEDLADPGADLRVLRGSRRRGIDRLARARELPRVFDSRGRILGPPPRPPREGELCGHPVSPGRVRGRVKVLHSPEEKPLYPGEVLVARATDPGWTPLFVHAGAVVLEVGGVMQHGALVAREYGKPCVAGVERATERLRDGALVEVDGAAGIVRICD
jgi:pyruvate,water dikinase